MARNPQGDFIWYELMTSDAEAAAAFYGKVVGWTNTSPPAYAETGYRLWHHGGAPVGGLLEMADCNEGGAMPPNWAGYVGVEDVDASVAAILAEGGKELMPATDVPGVGRLAFVTDPQGVPFYVMRGASDQISDAFSQSAVGHCNWNELAAPDPDAALAFWGKHFGWTKSGAMPMGADGDYSFVDHAGRTIGAILKTLNGRPPSFLFYFGVPDIDAAHAALLAGGGKVSYGPAEIPGGSMIVVATDPQGAWFGLVGPRKSAG